MVGSVGSGQWGLAWVAVAGWPEGAGQPHMPPAPSLPPHLRRLHRGLASCHAEASAYAMCCAASLPAISHRQCQREFERLSACVRQSLGRPK